MTWWIWLIVSLIVGIIELTTMTFVLLWIAVAGALTTVLSLVLPELWAQVLVFAIVSVVLVVITRPLVRKWKQAKTFPNRLETMIGKTGVVVTPAEPGAFATVRIEGDLWSAESASQLHAGQSVVVHKASATVLTVEPQG